MTKLHTTALAKAGLYTGLVLYTLCLVYFLVVYGGQGEWMVEPFMPGVSASLGGYLLGFVWSAVYGGGTLWLLGFFYNRAVREG